MVPHAGYGQKMTYEYVNELERALGVEPLHTRGEPWPQMWDRVATATGLPTSDDLIADGHRTLPYWVWNRAVDVANWQTAQQVR